MEERYTVPDDAFKEYDAAGVLPTSVHFNKEAHKESLDLLLEGILGTIADQREQSDEYYVDSDA